MSDKRWIEKIQALPLPKTLRIMNVCGGHERTLSASGIRTLLPEKIQIIPGPGCPVCVCPEKTLQFAIQLSTRPGITVVSFGDMLRVPANSKKSQINTLLESRERGNSVIAIASPLEAIALAKNKPEETIIFFIAGFETTIAPIAAMLAQGLPDNLKLLLSAKKTWPIVDQLLKSATHNLDGLIAPGHVASVMGSDEWAFVIKEHELPCAIAGFDNSSLLAGIYSICRQVIEGNVFLDNCYSSVVSPAGNSVAKKWINQLFTLDHAIWRGIGSVENSGFSLKASYVHYDAAILFSDVQIESQQANATVDDAMPAGCDCADVVLGRILPTDCRLFNTSCQPSQPKGPCMVSEEGACHIWLTTGTGLIPSILKSHAR